MSTEAQPEQPFSVLRSPAQFELRKLRCAVLLSPAQFAL